ncbi:DUF3613 domain-containing protein [Rhodanobacter sp. Col0626]|uniref:DUF3613 domain-containing protein n=1 Tax=Rhodanobacter sp. Col0626 TaxID=3415679 RepID=UPI003CF9AB00
MKTRFLLRQSSALLLTALLAAFPLGASAQQLPLTGQMMDGHQTTINEPASTPTRALPATAIVPAPSAAVTTRRREAPTMASSSAQPATTGVAHASSDDRLSAVVTPASSVSLQEAQIGDITRQLLQMQADNTAGGNTLPILGDEASASYSRYLKSFNHDIPEFYETTVGKGADGRR